MANAKAPAFQWYPKDYLTDLNVAVMTLAEEGAYRRLMDYEWLHEGLPTDVDELAALCGKVTPGSFKKMWPKLEKCFVRRRGKLIHPRLEKERRNQKARKKAKSASGRAGAKARWNKGNHGSAINSPMATDGSSSSSSSPSSSSSNRSTTDRLLSERLGSLIREKLWQANKPPPKAPPNWDETRDLDIIDAWTRQGFDEDEIRGAIRLYRGPPCTLAAWKKRGNAGTLNELIGQHRKGHVTRVGDVMEQLEKASPV